MQTKYFFLVIINGEKTFNYINIYIFLSLLFCDK